MSFLLKAFTLSDEDFVRRLNAWQTGNQESKDLKSQFLKRVQSYKSRYAIPFRQSREYWDDLSVFYNVCTYSGDYSDLAFYMRSLKRCYTERKAKIPPTWFATLAVAEILAWLSSNNRMARTNNKVFPEHMSTSLTDCKDFYNMLIQNLDNKAFDVWKVIDRTWHLPTTLDLTSKSCETRVVEASVFLKSPNLSRWYINSDLFGDVVESKERYTLLQRLTEPSPLEQACMSIVARPLDNTFAVAPSLSLEKISLLGQRVLPNVLDLYAATFVKFCALLCQTHYGKRDKVVGAVQLPHGREEEMAMMNAFLNAISHYRHSTTSGRSCPFELLVFCQGFKPTEVVVCKQKVHVIPKLLSFSIYSIVVREENRNALFAYLTDNIHDANLHIPKLVQSDMDGVGSDKSSFKYCVVLNSRLGSPKRSVTESSVTEKPLGSNKRLTLRPERHHLESPQPINPI